MKKLSTLSATALIAGAAVVGLAPTAAAETTSETTAATGTTTEQSVPVVTDYAALGEILSCRYHPKNFYCPRN